MDPDPGGPKTCGSCVADSNPVPDPDPQHCFIKCTISVADPGYLCWIPVLNFSIPDPGSKRSRIRIK
jgi:hypothetical protein